MEISTRNPTDFSFLSHLHSLELLSCFIPRSPFACLPSVASVRLQLSKRSEILSTLLCTPTAKTSQDSESSSLTVRLDTIYHHKHDFNLVLDLAYVGNSAPAFGNVAANITCKNPFLPPSPRSQKHNTNSFPPSQHRSRRLHLPMDDNLQQHDHKLHLRHRQLPLHHHHRRLHGPGRFRQQHR